MIVEDLGGFRGLDRIELFVLGSPGANGLDGRLGAFAARWGFVIVTCRA
jgi:hypothetical protein